MQYFLWKDDASSDLLLDRVIQAADRGVRVRMLVGDSHLIGADRRFAALNQHPQTQLAPQPSAGKGDCAALPADLIAGELSGRGKEAFTGATTTQIGRFELAKGSTIFLDEIGKPPRKF